MSDLKICANCKHAKRGPWGYELGRCKLVIGDVVTGEWEFCDIERRFGKACGKAGKLFEQKRPWYAFWRAK